MSLDVPTITLLTGPASVALPCVLMRFSTSEHTVPILMLADRTVFVPQWLDGPQRSTIIEFARRFEKEHRVVIHELLRRARKDIKINLAPHYGGLVLEPPTLVNATEVAFRVRFRDAEVLLHVSRDLAPCQIHLSDGEPCTCEYLFGAYDIVLQYMKTHKDELGAAGFDTSVLVASIQAWESYRQRLRLT